jgi:DNA modification methylase
MNENTIYEGDCIQTMKQWPDACVQTCITSPPYYGLRDYGHDGQIGLEETPEAFVQKLVEVFREVRRVLKDDGTLWLNLGDSYAGSGKGSNSDGTAHASSLLGKQGTHKGTTEGTKPIQKAGEIGLKPKDLIGIPWRVAFALQADGWYLRQDIIWHKPNPMPESVTDRCTKAHEYIFLLSKSSKYYFDNEAIKEDCVNENMPGSNMRDTRETYGEQNGGNSGLRDLKKKYKDGDWPTTRNKRSVWTVTTKPYSGAHFATFPPDLIEPCILAGCPEGGIVLDPFMGSGTTAHTALRAGRKYVGCELNGDYIKLANQRLSQGFLL